MRIIPSIRMFLFAIAASYIRARDPDQRRRVR